MKSSAIEDNQVEMDWRLQVFLKSDFGRLRRAVSVIVDTSGTVE